MGQSHSTNSIDIDTDYEIPEGTTTEVVFGGSPLTTTYNGTLYLFPRRKTGTTQIFPPNVTTGNAWLIDGNFYSRFRVSGDAAFAALWASGKLTGYYHVGYRLSLNQGPLGIQRYTVTSKYSESVMRLLEKMHPRYNAAAGPSFSQSLAAGADLTGSFDANPGDEIIVMGGISQDSLGTTPHASFIYVNDKNGATVWNVIGALLPSAVMKFRCPFQNDANATQTFSYKAYNGDSVAHYFALNVYIVYS